MSRTWMPLLLAVALLAGCDPKRDRYTYLEHANAAVGRKAGVVMHGFRISATIDGLDIAQRWITAFARLLDSRGPTLNTQVKTVREHTDGRYGLYTLARAQHWWTSDSARHEDTASLAGNAANWDFKTDDTYPKNWTHDFLVKNANDGTRGPSNTGRRRLYQRYDIYERWSK